MRHSVGLSVVIRKEAVIGTSKILTEESKDLLRKSPLLSQLLFGGKVSGIQGEFWTAAELLHSTDSCAYEI